MVYVHVHMSMCMYGHAHMEAKVDDECFPQLLST